MWQGLELSQAGLHTRQLPAGVDAVGHRRCRGLFRAQQRRAAAGAALVNQHHVAPVGQARQDARHRARQVHRALPRPAGKEQHRVGFAIARQGGQHGVVHLDLRALRLAGVQRALEHAAPGFVLQSLQTAGFQTRPTFGRLARASSNQQHGRRPAYVEHQVHGRILFKGR